MGMEHMLTGRQHWPRLGALSRVGGESERQEEPIWPQTTISPD